MKESLNDPARLAWELACLNRTRNGDLEAFGELYRAYAPSLYSYVLIPRLGNRAAAEDALSETFRAALERFSSFEQHETSIYFWLMRIAVNKVNDLYRARKVSGRSLIDCGRLLEPLLPRPDDPEALLGTAQSSERIKALVGRCLKSINPRYQRAIELRFLEEKNRQECADELQVTLGTFDVLLLRALRAFRTAWSDLGASQLEKSHVA